MLRCPNKKKPFVFDFFLFADLTFLAVLRHPKFLRSANKKKAKREGGQMRKKQKGRWANEKKANNKGGQIRKKQKGPFCFFLICPPSLFLFSYLPTLVICFVLICPPSLLLFSHLPTLAICFFLVWTPVRKTQIIKVGK